MRGARAQGRHRPTAAVTGGLGRHGNTARAAGAVGADGAAGRFAVRRQTNVFLGTAGQGEAQNRVPTDLPLQKASGSTLLLAWSAPLVRSFDVLRGVPDVGQAERGG